MVDRIKITTDNIRLRNSSDNVVFDSANKYIKTLPVTQQGNMSAGGYGSNPIYYGTQQTATARFNFGYPGAQLPNGGGQYTNPGVRDLSMAFYMDIPEGTTSIRFTTYPGKDNAITRSSTPYSIYREPSPYSSTHNIWAGGTDLTGYPVGYFTWWAGLTDLGDENYYATLYPYVYPGGVTLWENKVLGTCYFPAPDVAIDDFVPYTNQTGPKYSTNYKNANGTYARYPYMWNAISGCSGSSPRLGVSVTT